MLRLLQLCRLFTAGCASAFSHLLAYPAMMLAAVLLPQSGRAEYFSRGLLTYVSPSQAGGVVAVITAHGTADGLFIAYLPQGSVQSFDPGNLPPQAATIFLAYSSSKNKFEEVILANGQHYGVGGSFAVELGPAIVSLNLQPLSSYLSVVTDRSAAASILGIANGLQPVVNSGGAIVEVLAANSALSERSGVISTYKVNADTGGLLLGDLPFTGSQIGISIESANPCLTDPTTILTNTDYEKWINASSASSLDQFHDSKLALSTLTVLTSTSDFITVLDPQGKLGVIRKKQPREDANFEAPPLVCVFTAL